MCTLQTGKLCYNTININYVRNLSSYAELQESQSIFLLSWSFVKEFTVSSYRWSYAQLCKLTQDKSTKLWEPWHILRDRIGVGLVKSLDQDLWPISLHLISKRIKEILTQNTNIMRNIYPDSMMKMFSGNTLSGVCVYMYVTFLVGEIVDRFLGRALYRWHFVTDKEPRQSVFFCLLLKETWICFNPNIVWQLLHRLRPVLCLNISTPLEFCAFSKSSLLNRIPAPNPPPPPSPHPRLDIIKDNNNSNNNANIYTG